MTNGNHPVIFLNDEGLYIISIQKHSLTLTDCLKYSTDRRSTVVVKYNKRDPARTMKQDSGFQ